MCLLMFGLDAHPDYALVIAANRDEYYARPSAPAGFWTDAPAVLAGRDLQHGGTWLGVNRRGRFAALTNYRDPCRMNPEHPSRGRIVSDCLRGELPPEQYILALDRSAVEYNGFSLMTGDAGGVFYYSNRDREVRRVTRGIHGLSNHLLDSPWPKVTSALAGVRAALHGDSRRLPDALLGALADPTVPADDALPDTGVGLELERALGAIFVQTPEYGTRCSTVMLVDHAGRVRFFERTYPGDGSPPDTVCLEFHVSGGPGARRRDDNAVQT